MNDTPQDQQGPRSDDRSLLREPDLAARWQKSLRTLQRWRGKGFGPAHLRLGGTVYYRLEDILAFEAGLRTDPVARA